MAQRPLTAQIQSQSTAPSQPPVCRLSRGILIHQREGQRKRAPPTPTPGRAHSQKPHPAPAASPGIASATGRTGRQEHSASRPAPAAKPAPDCNLLAGEIPSLCTESHRTQTIEWLLLIRRDRAGKWHVRRRRLSVPLLRERHRRGCGLMALPPSSQPEPCSPPHLRLSAPGGGVPRVSFSRRF